MKNRLCFQLLFGAETGGANRLGYLPFYYELRVRRSDANLPNHIYLLGNNSERSQPAKYTEIQVNQLTDTSEGFLPPIHSAGMYSVVH